MILKRILKVCVFALAIVGALLSCTVPFIAKQNGMTVSALTLSPADSETTDTYFSSSNFLIPVAFSTGDENAPLVSSYGVSFASLKIDLHYVSGISNFEINVDSASTNVFDNQYGYLPSVSSTLSVATVSNTSNSWVHTYFPVYNFVNSQYTIPDLVLNFNYRNYNFNGTVAYIVVSYTSTINQRIDGTIIRFYDTNNGNFEFQFYGGSNSNPQPFSNYSSYVPARTIYIIQNLTDNQYYNSGKADGQSIGEQIGYNSGYGKGYDKGYDDGYYDGSIDLGGNSFPGLITGAVMAPVNMFKAFFNFEILGFNILNLITGLITFAVVVLIIKRFIGGR